MALGNCADVNPTNSNPYEFAGAVPCPLSQVGLTSSIDTTKLEDGVHTISVAVEDAAGNRAPVVAPGSRFTVRNGVPNGTPAGRTANGRLKVWFDATRARCATRASSASAWSCAGTCATAAGAASAAPRSRCSTTSPAARGC